MGRIIAVANQKGGVGKTTTTINLGTCLSEMGKKVLLIDSDPQGNMTSGMGVTKEKLNVDIYDCLIKGVSLGKAILATSHENLSIVPATIQLGGAEIELTSVHERERRLANAIEEVKKDYDYIFIDCPPALGLVTLNAMTACDGVLIPVQTEFYALEGLGQLLSTIQLVRKHFNSEIKVEGVLLTMYDARTNLGAEVVEEVQKYFTEKVYKTIIPRIIAIAEAPSAGLSIVDYDTRSKGAKMYRELAKEVLAHG